MNEAEQKGGHLLNLHSAMTGAGDGSLSIPGAGIAQTGILKSGYFRILHEVGSILSLKPDIEFKKMRRRLMLSSFGRGVLF